MHTARPTLALAAFLTFSSSLPATAQSILQEFIWHDQTKTCVNAIKSGLSDMTRWVRYLEIEQVAASSVERNVHAKSDPVRVSGVLDIEGVFTVGDRAAECAYMRHEIEVGQKPKGSLPQSCSSLLERLDSEVQWHDTLGFRLTDGRSSRAKLAFACEFGDPSSKQIKIVEPLKKAQ